MNFRNNFNVVKQPPVTKLGREKHEMAKMGFPCPICVTRGCMTVVKLVLMYTNLLVSVTEPIIKP